MSKLKKMLSLVVAMVMVLAMSIPTFAATGKTEKKQQKEQHPIKEQLQ